MIKSFSEEYRWLSNFWPATVVYDGVEYPAVEHAYQAAKTENFNDRAIIRSAATPGLAKRLGAQVKLRKDWEKIRVLVMFDLLRQKLSATILDACCLKQDMRSWSKETLGAMSFGAMIFVPSAVRIS